MTRRKRRGDPGALFADPDFAPAILWAVKRGTRQGLTAYAWAAGWLRDGRARASAVAVLERYKRVAAALKVTVGGIRVAGGVEVRASLARYRGREAAHLRTWYRSPDGQWWPTRRGVTVAPEQLEALETMVRELREAYAAGVLEQTSASQGPEPDANRGADA